MSSKRSSSWKRRRRMTSSLGSPTSGTSSTTLRRLTALTRSCESDERPKRPCAIRPSPFMLLGGLSVHLHHCSARELYAVQARLSPAGHMRHRRRHSPPSTERRSWKPAYPRSLKTSCT